jgi:hypothetical protein
MNKLLIAGSLAATTALAQITGDWGRATHMSSMMGGSTFGSLVFTLFWIGLVILVWLWVVKLWKEVRRMK